MKENIYQCRYCASERGGWQEWYIVTKDDLPMLRAYIKKGYHYQLRTFEEVSTEGYEINYEN